MNGWAIVSLVFIYGITTLNLLAIPNGINKPTVFMPVAVSIAVFVEMLDIVAIIIIWANNDPWNMTLTIIAIVLVATDIAYIIWAVARTGKIVTQTRNTAIRSVLLSTLWLALVSILAFSQA